MSTARSGQQQSATMVTDAFSITREGRERTVKPHRYAVALKLGVPVEFGEVVEHIVCDNPICCRAHPEPGIGHVWPSTQADNLRRMASRGRGGGRRWWVRRWSGLSRPERATFTCTGRRCPGRMGRGQGPRRPDGHRPRADPAVLTPPLRTPATVAAG